MVSFKTTLVALLLPVSIAASNAAAPLPPTQDPFYTAPDDYEHKAPGTVLRKRHVPGNLTQIYNSSAAYNIVYRTTGARHEASWAVTTLLVPANTSSDALLSYQIPYNTPDVDKSPSFSLGQPDKTTLSDVSTALQKGWFVNIPDHEGHNAAFGAAVGNGFATLDSVRAVLKTCGLRKDPKIALWGYSGGSIASEAAAELQVVYAPDLHIAGAALGGLVSNLTAVFETVNSGFFAGLIVLSLLGTGNEYPDVKSLVLSHLKEDGPFNKTGFLAGQHMDAAHAFGAYHGQDIWKYFDIGRDILNDPAIVNLLNDNAYMGYQGTPKIPLFIYKAVHDDVTPIDSTDKLVDRYCGVGVSILYERNTIGNHLQEEINGDAGAMEWLTKVLSGKLNQTGCTIRDVAINATAPTL